MIAALSSAALMLTSSGVPFLPETVYAVDDPPAQSQNAVNTLASVTDFHWVEDSSATVSWTGVPIAALPINEKLRYV